MSNNNSSYQRRPNYNSQQMHPQRQASFQGSNPPHSFNYSHQLQFPSYANGGQFPSGHSPYNSSVPPSPFYQQQFAGPYYPPQQSPNQQVAAADFSFSNNGYNLADQQRRREWGEIREKARLYDEQIKIKQEREAEERQKMQLCEMINAIKATLTADQPRAPVRVTSKMRKYRHSKRSGRDRRRSRVRECEDSNSSPSSSSQTVANTGSDESQSTRNRSPRPSRAFYSRERRSQSTRRTMSAAMINRSESNALAQSLSAPVHSSRSIDLTGSAVVSDAVPARSYKDCLAEIKSRFGHLSKSTLEVDSMFENEWINWCGNRTMGSLTKDKRLEMLAKAMSTNRATL